MQACPPPGVNTEANAEQINLLINPIDTPGDPGSPGFDSTDTETCWDSLAEQNTKEHCDDLNTPGHEVRCFVIHCFKF